MPGTPHTPYWTFFRVLLAGTMVLALLPFSWYVWERGFFASRPVGPIELPLPDLDAARGSTDVYRERGRMSMFDDRPRVLRDHAAFNLTNLRVDRRDLIESRRPRDDDAAMHFPAMVDVADVDFLFDDDILLLLEFGGEARAYPTLLMRYHGVINDVIGDTPLAIVYCYLADAFSVVDRRVGDATLEFGISNVLLNSNMLLFDTTDRALWSQVGLGAISGPHAGQRLTHINRWRIVRFDQLLAEHPDARVLSNYTGREYGRGFGGGSSSFRRSNRIFYPLVYEDPTIPARTQTIGVVYPDGRTVAYLIDGVTGEVRDWDLRIACDAPAEAVEIVEAPDGAAVVHTAYFAWFALHPHTQVVAATGGPDPS